MILTKIFFKKQRKSGWEAIPFSKFYDVVAEYFNWMKKSWWCYLHLPNT